MGHMQEIEYRDRLGKKEGLQMHLRTNFFPPHPNYVIESCVAGFEEYWDKKIGLDELKDKCYLRRVDGLYRYFDAFLNEEDL